MKIAATVGTKNQITIPRLIREVFGLQPKDIVMFDWDTSGGSVSLTFYRGRKLDEQAGSVPDRLNVGGVSWEEIRMRAWDPEKKEWS